MGSCVSVLAASISTELGGLDVSDVVGEIVVHVGVTIGVKIDLVGVSTGISAISRIVRFVDSSGDLSVSGLEVVDCVNDLSGSGLGDWNLVGVVLAPESLLGDSDEVGGWDLSLTNSGDRLLNDLIDLSGALGGDDIDDSLFNDLDLVLNELVVDGLLNLLDLNI